MDADLSTDSGRIQLRRGSGTTRAHCVSGRIDLGLTGACDVDAETVSGRIRVELPEGVRAYRPEVGEDTESPPDGYDCVVAARSVSGRVNVSSR